MGIAVFARQPALLTVARCLDRIRPDAISRTP
jgi:hypothetical protein